MRSIKRAAVIPPVMIICLLISVVASAYPSPSVDLQFKKTELKSGGWEYDYTISNLSEDSSMDLFLFTLFLSPDMSATIIEKPSGWEVLVRPFFASFFPVYANADIAPGSEAHFVLQSIYEVDELSFMAALTNPYDPLHPLLAQGLSHESPPVVTPAPLAPTALLFGSGLITCAAMRRKGGQGNFRAIG